MRATSEQSLFNLRNGNIMKHPQIIHFECCTLIWSKTHGLWSTLIVPIKLHWFDNFGGARFGWASRISIPSQGSPPGVTEKFQIFSYCIFACLSLHFQHDQILNMYEHLQSTECTSTSTISSTCRHPRIRSFSRIWNLKELDFPAHCSCSHWVRNWKLFGIVWHLPQLHYAVRV